jgi:hypothetical protein
MQNQIAVCSVAVDLWVDNTKGMIAFWDIFEDVTDSHSGSAMLRRVNATSTSGAILSSVVDFIMSLRDRHSKTDIDAARLKIKDFERIDDRIILIAIVDHLASPSVKIVVETDKVRV